MDFRYITYALNGMLMIAMPMIIAVILIRKFKLDWGGWFIGAATFILSQVGHIPFNIFSLPEIQEFLVGSTNPVVTSAGMAVFLGLSAGLFEEISRYGMFRWWAKAERSWEKSVLLGAGHGGAEAMILGILALVVLFEMTAYRDVDFFSLSKFTSGEAIIAQAQVASYWSAPWYLTILGAVERFFTIPIQISLAVIVYQAFSRNQWFWVPLAILYHTLIDSSAVLASQYLGIYWTEAFVAFYALLSLLIITKLRQKAGESTFEEKLATKSPNGTKALSFGEIKETQENLESSKYLS